MADYLSAEWFEQLDATDVTDTATSSEATDLALVLQHVVTDGPAGEVRYHVRIVEQAVSIVRGQAEQPDVTFTEDYVTASAIAGGQLSAPAALLAGRIRVGGDMAALIKHQDILSVTDPVPAAVRAATTYR